MVLVVVVERAMQLCRRRANTRETHRYRSVLDDGGIGASPRMDGEISWRSFLRFHLVRGASLGTRLGHNKSRDINI